MKALTFRIGMGLLLFFEAILITILLAYSPKGLCVSADAMWIASQNQFAISQLEWTIKNNTPTAPIPFTYEGNNLGLAIDPKPTVDELGNRIDKYYLANGNLRPWQ